MTGTLAGKHCTAATSLLTTTATRASQAFWGFIHFIFKPHKKLYNDSLERLGMFLCLVCARLSRAPDKVWWHSEVTGDKPAQPGAGCSTTVVQGQSWLCRPPPSTSPLIALCCKIYKNVWSKKTCVSPCNCTDQWHRSSSIFTSCSEYFSQLAVPAHLNLLPQTTRDVPPPWHLISNVCPIKQVEFLNACRQHKENACVDVFC